MPSKNCLASATRPLKPLSTTVQLTAPIELSKTSTMPCPKTKNASIRSSRISQFLAVVARESSKNRRLSLRHKTRDLNSNKWLRRRRSTRAMPPSHLPRSQPPQPATSSISTQPAKPLSLLCPAWIKKRPKPPSPTETQTDLSNRVTI